MDDSRGIMADSGITFDEKHNVRIVDPAKVDKSRIISEKAQQFGEKLLLFQELVGEVMTVMNARASRIENEKLRAIGMRNRVVNEVETRKRRTEEYQVLITEKQIELDRVGAELDSLLKVEHEQQKLIEQLSNNEPNSYEA